MGQNQNKSQRDFQIVLLKLRKLITGGVPEKNIFLIGIDAFKAEKSLHGKKLQKKEEKDEKHIVRLFKKPPKI